MGKNLKLSRYIVIILCVFVLSNCGEKCHDGEYDVYSWDFSKDTLRVAYNGYEKLKFLRISFSDTDTVIFTGIGKTCFIDTSFVIEDDMCTQMHIENYRYLTYYSELKDDSIKIKLESTFENHEMMTVKYRHVQFYCHVFYIGESFLGRFFNEIFFNGKPYYYLNYYVPIYSEGDTLYYKAFNGIIRFSLNQRSYSLTLIN